VAYSHDLQRLIAEIRANIKLKGELLRGRDEIVARSVELRAIAATTVAESRIAVRESEALLEELLLKRSGVKDRSAVIRKRPDKIVAG